MDNPMTAIVADVVQLDVLTVDNDNKTCLFLRLQDSTGSRRRKKIKLKILKRKVLGSQQQSGVKNY